MLINMTNRNRMIYKHKLISLIIIFLALFFTSCKTCKCPAYSQTRTKPLQEIQLNSFPEKVNAES